MRDESIIGSNLQTPGAMSYPSSMLTDTSTNDGLQLDMPSVIPAGQVPFRVVDNSGNRIFEVTINGPIIYGQKMLGGVFFNAEMALDGTQNPPCLELADGAGAGMRVWSGTGVPTSTTVSTGRVGDWYLRRDTMSTANQRLYVCSVAGTPGTWVGIA